MRKITLLGDSIRMNYSKEVQSLLRDEYEIYQPDDNGRFSKYTLRQLFDLKERMRGSQVVHWNNGLWDICNLFGDGAFTSTDEYVENMLKIAGILLERHEKVIFATTTPVTEQNPHDSNELIAEYNNLIVPKLKKMGVIINDLHTLVLADVDSYIRKDDNIHLTEAGIKVCAEQTAKIIRQVSENINK